MELGGTKSQIADSTSLGDGEDTPAEYCRRIEAYLCRKNDGHLIRIVGPSFETVCAWAARGVPMAIALRGIDRYFDRYYAKGPRRRPVRIDFCEADVLDVFDEWRRAVGVPTSAVSQAGASSGQGADLQASDAGADVDAGPSRRTSLPAHLERVVARLTALRAGGSSAGLGAGDRTLDPMLDAIVRELDAVRASAKGIRGAARAALLDRLAVLDAQLLAAVRDRFTGTTRDELRAEAERELAPFRARMPRDAYEQSLAACTDRLIRERARLPVLTLD